MQPLSHLLYAVFSFMFAVTLVDWKLALIPFFFHLFPLIDAPIKRLIKFEPLHTLWAFLIIELCMYLFFSPLVFFLSFVGYAPHLILDLFVEEGLVLLYPKKLKFSFPIKHSDLIIQVISIMGILTCLLVLSL